MSPKSVEETFKDFPASALVNRLPRDQFGWPAKLVNHGQGTAFGVQVTWFAHKVNLKSESFEIDSRKREEPKYAPECNAMPSSPSHIPANASATLTRIPLFASLDPEAQLESIDGEVRISCRDAFGTEWETVQDVYVEVGYMSDPAYFHCAFGEVRQLPSYL
ncbi:hypothetical protein [Streptomyces sp. NBC_01435]|uniref:hypothetical protein n=1 Tax=Streptomyces sp. NBC_01435 TaxID=2903865 RepID=UPI002E33CAD1|nr:hypothetical protein [Streptomyces sp. NBC_01435]